MPQHLARRRELGYHYVDIPSRKKRVGVQVRVSVGIQNPLVGEMPGNIQIAQRIYCRADNLVISVCRTNLYARVSPRPLEVPRRALRPQRHGGEEQEKEEKMLQCFISIDFLLFKIGF